MPLICIGDSDLFLYVFQEDLSCQMVLMIYSNSGKSTTCGIHLSVVQICAVSLMTNACVEYYDTQSRLSEQCLEWRVHNERYLVKHQNKTENKAED